MRVTGGVWCGRVLKAPKGDAVRPTQDRVREALFSMLQNDLAGKSFLDLYAGSGLVGIEALSRGAASATLVELEARHIAVIRENAALVKAVNAEVIRADALAWLKTAGVGRQFGVAYADPPYPVVAEMGYGEMLRVLAEGNVVAPEGLFIAEMRANRDADLSPYWDLCRDRVYGQTRLAIYRRNEELGNR